MKKIFAISLLLLFGSGVSKAQQLESIFAAQEDASLYVENYMAPLMNGIVYNLSNGWYSRAKPHHKLGFDVTVNMSVSIVPKEDLIFHFNPDDYTYLKLADAGEADLPTVAGEETNTLLKATHQGAAIEFNAVNGIGGRWPKDFFIPVSIPTPMLQVGFGLPFKTEVKLRYCPQTGNEDVEFGLFGGGIQHDLSQYIPLLKSVPTLTIAGLAAFTSATTIYNSHEIPGSQEGVKMTLNSYTAQLIGGVNLKIINFYLGMGYVGGNATFKNRGYYEFDYNTNGSIEGGERVTNSINVDFDTSSVKATVGARINIGPVKLFSDYTFQKYPSVNMGIAVSLR